MISLIIESCCYIWLIEANNSYSNSSSEMFLFSLFIKKVLYNLKNQKYDEIYLGHSLNEK